MELAQPGGGEGQGEQQCRFRKKALMRDLGNRLECRQKVIPKQRKTK